MFVYHLKAAGTNNQHEARLAKASLNCGNIAGAIESVRNNLNQGQQSLGEASRRLDECKASLKQLQTGDSFKNMEARGRELEDQEIEISGLVEDYRTRFIMPCHSRTDELAALLDEMGRWFGGNGRGSGWNETISAAGAYIWISEAIQQARELGSEAIEKAGIALDKVTPAKRADQPDADDERSKSLRVQTEIARVRSKDLRQEAEGLKHNGMGMNNDLNGLKVRWHTLLSKVKERASDLGQIQRNLGLIGSFKNDLQTSFEEDSLARVRKVEEAILRVPSEIRTGLTLKTRELQSFSSDELGNIPRKRKLDFCIGKI